MSKIDIHTFKQLLAKAQQLYSTVMRSLQSAKSKELFTFLLFLAISALFWLFQTLEEKSNATFKLPIHYTHLPKEGVFIQELPTSIKVELQDKGSTLLGYYIKGLSPLEVDFAPYNALEQARRVSTTQLTAELKSQLKSTTTRVASTPDSITISYTTAPPKVVLIQLRTHITTRDGSTLSGTIERSVDSVQLFAPRERLEQISVICTDTLELIDLSETTTLTCQLVQPNETKIVPATVTLTIPVEELIYKELEIPIVPYNLIDQHTTVLTFPASAHVVCQLPVSKFAHLDPKKIVLGVDCSQIQSLSDQSKLKVTLIDSPSYITNLHLTPDSVQYLIEENQLLP